ncbi:protein of unknown function [Xenorhabdus doucetiae]|uniref:Uncharacterized protein n=1 Tax=Xenorhabdus doucetiae TaxID=351671 RepID=A0A068QWV4_9GAMM|nr:protein of unknown function [Xenorhabdus doucetiae]
MHYYGALELLSLPNSVQIDLKLCFSLIHFLSPVSPNIDIKHF